MASNSTIGKQLDRDKDLEAFDTLPDAVKHILWIAPYDVSARHLPRCKSLANQTQLIITFLHSQRKAELAKTWSQSHPMRFLIHHKTRGDKHPVGWEFL